MILLFLVGCGSDAGKTATTVATTSSPGSSVGSIPPSVTAAGTTPTTKPAAVEASGCFGPVTSQGFNLLGSDSQCAFAATASDIVNADPLLGPLQNNGGPTATQDLAPGSPAIDTGNPATPGSGGTACLRADQRGIPRADDGDLNGSNRCDIGAIEATAIDSKSYRAAYDGWTGVTSSAASGGDYRTASTANQTLTFTNQTPAPTTSVSIITYKGPDQGRIAITIDGNSAGKLDLYAATPKNRATIAFTVASATKHTIIITVIGTHNVASTGSAFRLDIQTRHHHLRRHRVEHPLRSLDRHRQRHRRRRQLPLRQYSRCYHHLRHPRPNLHPDHR